MNNKKQEVLQSRREFFKSAAKAALPVIGVAVLAQLPIKASAGNPWCMEGNCTAHCASSCRNTCNSMCDTSCRGYME